MKKQADYIKRIEIKGLWGRKNISWDLRADVNILSGVNGIGKSTILNNSVRYLNELEGHALTNGVQPGVSFVFSPEDANFIRFDVIRSFDRPLINSGLLEKIGNSNVKTELDWQLYLLQRRYLDYQVNIGNRIIELLTSGVNISPSCSNKISLLLRLIFFPVSLKRSSIKSWNFVLGRETSAAL